MKIWTAFDHGCDPPIPECSFCFATELYNDDVRVTGKNVAICGDCARLAFRIVILHEISIDENEYALRFAPFPVQRGDNRRWQ